MSESMKKRVEYSYNKEGKTIHEVEEQDRSSNNFRFDKDGKEWEDRRKSSVIDLYHAVCHLEEEQIHGVFLRNFSTQLPFLKFG